jgi:hypothetical protein
MEDESSSSPLSSSKEAVPENASLSDHLSTIITHTHAHRPATQAHTIPSTNPNPTHTTNLCPSLLPPSPRPPPLPQQEKQHLTSPTR